MKKGQPIEKVDCDKVLFEKLSRYTHSAYAHSAYAHNLTFFSVTMSSGFSPADNGLLSSKVEDFT